MKKCSTCKLKKTDVSKNGKCKQCNNEYMRQYKLKNQDKIKKYQQEYDAKFYVENKEEILAGKKEYYQANRNEILKDRRKYYDNNKEEKQEYNQQYYQENREAILEYEKEYRVQNTDKIRKYQKNYAKNRRMNDSNFRIRQSVSANINYYLKFNNSSKNGESCLDYLPFAIEKLHNYLENQFEQWMNWNNYGRYDATTWNDNNQTTWTWQIDHIIPQSKLPYTSMENDNFKKCWALENLRPLSAKQNLLDGVNRTRH